jgi:thioredoxin 1
MASAHVVNVTKANFEAEVLKSTTPVVVDFWASWCGPCKMIAPLLDQVADENPGKFKVAKVDVDAEGELAAQFNVNSIPLLLFFKDGAKKAEHIGANITKKGLVEKLSTL